MSKFSIIEFKPTIFFLTKFIGLYLIGNILYGIYVTHYHPAPDPVTRWVGVQTAGILTVCGWPSSALDKDARPITQIIYNKHSVLDVYEGCNGINTMIIFVAFVFAFGPLKRSIGWFIPLGILLIHLVNLARVGLLFLVVQYRPDFLYFTHKYFFTAILYFVIFALWLWWAKNNPRIR